MIERVRGVCGGDRSGGFGGRLQGDHVCGTAGIGNAAGAELIPTGASLAGAAASELDALLLPAGVVVAAEVLAPVAASDAAAAASGGRRHGVRGFASASSRTDATPGFDETFELFPRASCNGVNPRAVVTVGSAPASTSIAAHSAWSLLYEAQWSGW